jgi:hypothetical protein
VCHLWAECVQQRLDNGKVRRDPGKIKNSLKVSQGHPAQFVMVLQRMGLTLDDFRLPDPHAGPLVQPPATGGFGRQLRPQQDPDAQFLQELPVQRGLTFFAGFHLAPRELPESGKLLGGRPPCHQQAGRIVQRVENCCANYLNLFTHCPSL